MNLLKGTGDEKKKRGRGKEQKNVLQYEGLKQFGLQNCMEAAFPGSDPDPSELWKHLIFGSKYFLEGMAVVI